jgi:hypothetical protein
MILPEEVKSRLQTWTNSFATVPLVVSEIIGVLEDEEDVNIKTNW